MNHTSAKCPVSIVTGFLGSGKTTLLSEVLSHPKMKHTAVLVNEFGKVGLDHHLLQRIDEQTILLGSGCLCCAVRSDLVNALKDLFDKFERGEITNLERVVIETSGLADPAPILFTILSDPILQHHFFIDSVITTVDAVNGKFHLESQPESWKQVAVADKIVVTKTDIASEDMIHELAVRLRLLNPSAEIIKAVFGNVDVKTLFQSERKNSFLTNVSDTGNSYSGSHAGDTRSISFTFDKPLDWTAFGIWLSMLLHAKGQNVLRVKGMLDVGEQGPVVLNGVQHIIHPPQHLNEWPGDDRRSHVVFIMREIEPWQIEQSLHAFQDILGSKATLVENIHV